MYRLTLATLLICWAATSARADALFLKDERTGKLEVEGLDKEINGVPVTPDNVALFLEQSKGYIARLGYDGIDWARSEKSRNTDFYPWSRISSFHFTPSQVPPALLDGEDSIALQAWSQAISAFRDVWDDTEQREAFRYEALHKMGLCYALAGNFKSATSHFEKWPTEANSIWTVRALDLHARILLTLNQVAKAREVYAQLGALPKLPDDWKQKAALGDVRADLQERKYADAKRKARGVAAATENKRGLESVYALAEALYAAAVVGGGEADAMPGAQANLEKAARLDGLDDETAAEVYLQLGHAVYAQGKPDAARFPYMRVVTMYPDQTAFVSDALLNAGQCFLDLATQADNATRTAEADELTIKGMKLLYECAARYRSTGAGQKAAQTWTQNRRRLTEAEGRQGGG